MTPRWITQREAWTVIRTWHSHHDPPQGQMLCLGAYEGDECVGVVVIGNPTAPGLQGKAVEVTRLATNGHPNAASFLLGAAWRVARALGVRRAVSYTRADEAGTCYRAAGWQPVAQVKGRPHTTGNRKVRWLPGLYQPTTEIVDRVRWEKVA